MKKIFFEQVNSIQDIENILILCECHKVNLKFKFTSVNSILKMEKSSK